MAVSGREDRGAALSGDIDMFLWWSNHPEWIEELVTKYQEERPGVKVNLTFMTGNGVEENLEVRMAANKMPELTSGGVGSWYYDAADQGYLGDVGETEAWQKMLPGLQTALTSPKGVRLGVSYGVAYMYCYYNTDLFAKAGIDKVPESWEQWMDVCKKLKDAGITPLALPGASSNNMGHNVFSGAVAGVVTAKDPTIATAAKLMFADYDFNNEMFLNVFKRADELAKSGYVADGFMSADYDACVRAFADQSVAMAIEGSWSVSNFLKEDLPFKPGTFIPPYNAEGDPLYGTSCSETTWAIGGTPNVNKELALDIFNWFAYTKFAERQVKTGVVPPFAAKDIVGEIKLPEQSQSCSDAIASKEAVSPLMFTVMQNDVYSRATELVQEVMMGTTTPEQAVQVMNELQAAHFKK
jgi:ABC-type glycerol-3-phosphate transport system substrate-binding protein